MKDVAIIGAGIAGMATAARLQAKGFSTIVFEAHGQPGGCAGFYRRRGFAFDVGATTLVDFEPGGVGAELLEGIGMAPLRGEFLPGYKAWLPDQKVVTLYREPTAWAAERLQAFGDTSAHRAFWKLLDELSQVFWQICRRKGVKLPIQNLADIAKAARAIGPAHLHLARYLNWTIADALNKFGLQNEQALVGLLGMLIEDTVHSTVTQAPLINTALGVNIRGAGLTRHPGGMWGFWQQFRQQYKILGGELRVGCKVEAVRGQQGNFEIVTKRGSFQAAQVVSAIPIALTARLAPQPVVSALRPYLQRDATAQGGAIVVFLGVKDAQVISQNFTHHQLMSDYNQKMGNGNNMFISVSAEGDTLSAPMGYRAVMISTHCELQAWQALSDQDYALRKAAVGAQLVELARRVYPDLGREAVVYEVATPCTYARFLGRPDGAVGGVRQTLANANQHAVPHYISERASGFWLVGDTTWPGLGTVAAVLGSRIVAEGVSAHQKVLSDSRRRGFVKSENSMKYRKI